jgi:mono/diheme cytochrome c family protein
MRPTAHTSLIGAALIALTAVVSLSARAGQHQHPAEGAHHHPAAARLKNPVAPDAKSVAAGSTLYAKHCSECHGDTGDGDGMMVDDSMNPKPAKLNDADWKHGSTDGEIYTVIRDGVKGTDMKAFGSKMTAHELWDVVNYLRSIGPAKSH